MKIKVKSSYASRFKDRRVAYAAGDEIEVEEDLAAFLFRDSPDSFEEAKAKKAPAKKEAKAKVSPPKDKAVKAPPKKK